MILKRLFNWVYHLTVPLAHKSYIYVSQVTNIPMYYVVMMNWISKHIFNEVQK